MDDIERLAIKATLIESLVNGVVFSIPVLMILGTRIEKLVSIICITILLSIFLEFFMTYRPNMKSYSKLKRKYGKAFNNIILEELKKMSMQKMLQKNWFLLRYKEDQKVGLEL